MTVREQLYRILLTTAESLCDIQGYLVDHEELDPDDVLFNAANEAFRGIAPVLVRLHAEPELVPTVRAFLEALEQTP